MDELFQGFPKIARFSRMVVVTEKIDGTNAQILITEDGGFFTASRNRMITPENDNAGFSRWAHANKEELMKLGVGRHFGEWWGSGIQRGYGLTRGEKRFSLFNTSRWGGLDTPECCHVVPVLWCGYFDALPLDDIMLGLLTNGSQAQQGYMKPEGVVIYHTAGNVMFKKTFLNDTYGKG